MDSGANARHLIGKALYRQSPMYQMHVSRLHNPETIERSLLSYLGRVYPRSDSRRVPWTIWEVEHSDLTSDSRPYQTAIRSLDTVIFDTLWRSYRIRRYDCLDGRLVPAVIPAWR